MVQENSQLIQAFPLNEGTFIGVASNLDVKHKNIVHANAEGSLTIEFPNRTLTVGVKEGSDFAIVGAETLTSTAEVIVS